VSDRFENVASAEALIRSAVETHRKDLERLLSDRQRDLFYSFIDAGEPGLAFDEFCGILVNNRIEVTRKTYDELRACAFAMGVSWPQSDLLRALIRS